MKTKSFQQRLETAFPYDTYANTLRALHEGIAAGDDVIKGTRMFSSEIGDDMRGLIRRAGILMRFEEMCIAGDLPFKCTLSPMPPWPHRPHLRSKQISGGHAQPAGRARFEYAGPVRD
jgi:hypothetical protein